MVSGSAINIAEPFFLLQISLTYLYRTFINKNSPLIEKYIVFTGLGRKFIFPQNQKKICRNDQNQNRERLLCSY